MTTLTGIHERLRKADPLVALVAHDGKKAELVELLRIHRPLLAPFRLIATRSTGGLLERELNLRVEVVASGPEGGDLQLGARLVEGAIDAVIFLRDPLTAHPHEPDIQALLKVCDIRRIPLATNAASAEILLHFLAGRLDGTGEVT